MRKHSLYLAWALSLLATLGSLYFSQILHLPPCVLCWFQRVAMYPLVLILAAGIILRDRRVNFYALPLTLMGLLFAIYHNLLYYRFIPESAAPCSAGISCTTQQIVWGGFITIPLLSLAGFVLMTILLLIYKPEKTYDQGS